MATMGLGEGDGRESQGRSFGKAPLPNTMMWIIWIIETRKIIRTIKIKRIMRVVMWVWIMIMMMRIAV